MSDVKEISNSRSRLVALALAFATTCLAHAAILFFATWILQARVGVIDWRLDWNDAGMLGTLSVIWRMWFRQRA